jgi:hypothetical protein
MGVRIPSPVPLIIKIIMVVDLSIITMLYGDCKLYGPYPFKDGRLRCTLTGINANVGFSRFISFPKLLMECHLKRRLGDDETVDHIDGNNNDICNLQILSRVANALKAFDDGKSSSDHLVNYSKSQAGRDASAERFRANNPNAVFDDHATIIKIRNDYKGLVASETELAIQFGVSKRAIYNLLVGNSYNYIAGAISKSELQSIRRILKQNRK